MSHHLSVEDFSAHLEGRIGCLARSHDTLMRAPRGRAWTCSRFSAPSCSLRPFPRITSRLHGPDVRIDRESAVPLALAFHELTMNATTHGRLAHHRDAVEIRWQPVAYERATWLQVVWSERGLSIANPDLVPKGFGSELIERMLPLRARGSHEPASSPRLAARRVADSRRLRRCRTGSSPPFHLLRGSAS